MDVEGGRCWTGMCHTPKPGAVAPEPADHAAGAGHTVDGSLEALGLEGRGTLIVAHEDTRHPHVRVIANRVDPETGRAAKLGNSKLSLSRWAKGYERERGRV
ncbi:MAG: relaxase/mobilization nuclease domain-containing protein [Chloroflexota bacterium]|nr:relaxase/mobilization nuclease domain-containing protein [Chloroflexota bacterium]